MRIGQKFPVASLVVALLSAAHPALATPLEPDACTSLKSERESLLSDGVKLDMARGPEWAKTNNLPAERLAKIARLMAVEEQLSFRCGELVTARPMMKEAPKPVEKGDDGAKQASAPANGGPNAGAASAGAPKPKKDRTAAKTKKKLKDSNTD